jgi:hypothetical protein
MISLVIVHLHRSFVVERLVESAVVVKMHVCCDISFEFCYGCIRIEIDSFDIRFRYKVPGDNNNPYPICGNYPAERKI